MATVASKLLTAEEFWEWGWRPENQDKFYELDRGEIVEMPSPGEMHGVVCALLARLLWNYVFQHGRGYVCGNDTGFIVARDPDSVRGPDVMLFDEARRFEELSRKFAQSVPSLVVEVWSPEDRPGKMARRVKQYLLRGIPLVWVVDPEEQIVTVYRPGREHHVVEATEEITGEDVLPDLRFRVAAFFTLPGEEPAKGK